jgi:integrase
MPTDLPAATLELVDDVLSEWRATPASRDLCRRTVVAFAQWLAGRDTDLTTATRADCQAWLDERANVVAASTVVKNWSQLRAWYATAESDFADPLDGRRSPMARVPMPRAPKFARTHAATVAEVDALVATFDLRSGLGLRNAAMVSLMFRSGLRVGELGPLDLWHLDLEARTVLIAQSKNDEPRRPPLHPETIALLRRYLRRRGDWPGPLFVNLGVRRKSERLTVTACKNVVKKAAAAAAVPVSPHCLRRGFAVEYMANGGDIVTLMEIGGWSSEVMIYRYLADARSRTSQQVYDTVAARQLAAARGRRLRAV